MNQPEDLYNPKSNYRVKLVPVKIKLGTLSSGTFLIRKKDLKYLTPGGGLRIYRERYDHGTTVLVEECRSTGLGELWICQRF